MADTVITRFAPSPTGFLHIGGARTALFNWLYARAKGGRMLLRIEDTDRARSTQEAIDAILDGLEWLQLNWDGDVVYQHRNVERHRAVVEELLDAGKAYRCYCTPEELAEMREKARAEGRPPVYDGTWRDRDPSEAPEGVAPAIRLKTPREGETVVEDRVQGRVVVANRDLDDLILLRSDGTPTYMLSVVVDDHDAGVTHIIRGDDHLTNAARQLQIYDAMGWQAPVFAHVPLIHGPDGAKLSKRHGALGVEAYREMGYLPAAMRNYLVRLGWSHGDDEVISTEQMIEWFDLDGIGRSPARFDMAKLDHLNSIYIRAMDDANLTREVRSLLERLDAGQGFGRVPDEEDWVRIEKAMPHLKERAKTLLDIIDGARFIVARRPLSLDEKAARLLEGDARAHLSRLLECLEQVADWRAPALEEAIRGFAADAGLKLGQVAQPLRAALTGRTTSPGIFDVLEILGREEALARIKDQAVLQE
ncbi:MAG: glutamate--tRNA ligase [Alphaproteobacteria bacterium]|nr:MAG: glutamate--tRNA ligase [Alphaproteobacteria bacterium]